MIPKQKPHFLLTRNLALMLLKLSLQFKRVSLTVSKNMYKRLYSKNATKPLILQSSINA